MTRKQNNVEVKPVGENQYLVNNKVMNKTSVVSHISEWVRSTFVFRSGEVYLPLEKDLPVNNVDEPLVKLENFRETKMSALSYLIMIVLSIGIKIGREMERNENNKKE